MKTNILIRNATRLCYIFGVLMVLGACSSDNEETIEAVEDNSQSITILGNYIGTWNSTTPTATFTDFPISMRITQLNQAQTMASGEFFATSGFTSCCNSGDNDGTVTLTLNDGLITSFTYTDIIPDCTGTFEGTGTFENNNTLTIDFTGNDCDGEHTGVLSFVKQ